MKLFNEQQNKYIITEDKLEQAQTHSTVNRFFG